MVQCRWFLTGSRVREGRGGEGGEVDVWTPFPAAAGVFGRSFTLCTVSPFAL